MEGSRNESAEPMRQSGSVMRNRQCVRNDARPIWQSATLRSKEGTDKPSSVRVRLRRLHYAINVREEARP